MDDLIKVKVNGEWYIVPKHLISDEELYQFEWKVLNDGA